MPTLGLCGALAWASTSLQAPWASEVPGNGKPSLGLGGPLM